MDAAVVFDLGNVLVPWVPHRVISAACIEETDFFAWNTELDRGAPFAETVAAVRAAYPQWADELDAFRDRWPETLGDPFEDVLAIVDDLKRAGVAVFVLSNSSAETIPRSATITELLTRFDGVMLSGEVGALKPDPAIFHEAEGHFGLTPSRTWFVDDSLPNVEAARRDRLERAPLRRRGNPARRTCRRRNPVTTRNWSRHESENDLWRDQFGKSERLTRTTHLLSPRARDSSTTSRPRCQTRNSEKRTTVNPPRVMPASRSSSPVVSRCAA